MSDVQNHRLVLIAHGSRRAEANDEIRALTRKLGMLLGSAFADVRCAFLELADPDIPTALAAAAAQGPGTVVVLPYFLAVGRHVADDLPAALSEQAARSPQVRFVMAPYAGQSAQMPALLSALALQGLQP